MIRKEFSSFWAGLVLVVVVAAIPRLLSYDFSLPYVDYPDEPTWYLAGLEWREPFESYRTYLGDPPGYISVNVLVQSVLEAAGQPGLSPAVRVLRLISVVANLLTLVLIALTARLAVGDFAGLAAGMAWGLSPLVLEHGVYALPDPLVYCLVSLATWLAAVSLVESNHQHWCVWSTFAGLLAILVKYPVLSALAPGGIATLIVFARHRRRGARYLLIEAVVITAVVLWLFFIYGLNVSTMQREAATARDQGLANMLDLSRVVNNVYYAIVPINARAFAVVCGLGLLAFAYAKRRQLLTVRTPVIGVSVLTLVTIPWLASSFSLVSIQERLRDVLPATTAACVLLGIAVGQIWYVVGTPPPNLLPEFRGHSQRSRIGQGLLAAVLVALFIPQITASWQIVAEREPPDSRVTLRQWVDVNLEPGTILVTQDNHKTFNPFWGGIPYRNWVDWWMMDSIMEHSPEEWREETGISYAVILLEDRQEMERSDAGRDYLAQMLHLRDFVGVGRGPEMSVYRLWRMDVETDIRFGEQIVLVGYDQQMGESANFRFYWQAPVTPDNNYSLFIHLTTLDGSTPLAQADGSPAVPERPTLTWDDPGETLISPVFTLPLDVPAGEYRVLVGLYNFTTGVRLAVGDSDAYELMRIAVAD